MHLDVVQLDVPLKKKFTVSKGEAEIKTNLLTILDNRYFGEAAPSVHAGPDVATLREDVQSGLVKLADIGTVGIEALDEVDSWNLHPVARAAIMGMVVNYLSGESRRYPWELLGLGSPIGIRSSVTVGIDDPDRMIRAIKKSPYPIIKIKMGNEEDIMLLDAIEQIKDKEIRVDANGGWSCAKAEEMIHHLERLGVKIIEQPTDVEFVREWPHLKGQSEKVELIVDEGMNRVEDFEQIGSSVDGINIKPEKCGGILAGSKLAAKAREDGKKVMLGCMVESSVGIAQSIYMSSQADYFDLDGPLLLKEDIGRGIRYDREAIAVDREIIGGPKLRREILQKYIAK